MDIKTLYLVTGIVYLLVPPALLYALRGIQDRSAGLWCASWIAFGAGVMLVGARGLVPDFASFYLAHTLLLTGYVLRSESLLMEINPERRPSRQSMQPRILISVGYMAVFSYMLFTGVPDNTRIGVVNSLQLLFFAETLYLSEKLKRTQGYKGAKLLTLMSALFMVGFAFRAVGALTKVGGQGALGFGGDQVLIILFALTGFILGNFGFFQISSEKLQRKSESIRSALEDAQAMNADLDRVLREKKDLLKQLAVSSNAVRSGIAASTVTHELSQPIAAMTLNLGYAQRKIAEGCSPADLSEVIEDIAKDTQRAHETLNKIRALFTQGGEDFQQVNFSKIVAETLSLTEPRAEQLQIEVTTDIQPNVQVVGDAVQLRMMLMNLMTNSIEALDKYAEQRRIDCRLRFQDGLAVFDIADTGPGIDEHAAKDIFDLYVSSKPHGSGIGLWLCRLIAESHKGSIQYARHAKGGAHFTVELPFAMA